MHIASCKQSKVNLKTCTYRKHMCCLVSYLLQRAVLALGGGAGDPALAHGVYQRVCESRHLRHRVYVICVHLVLYGIPTCWGRRFWEIPRKYPRRWWRKGRRSYVCSILFSFTTGVVEHPKRIAVWGDDLRILGCHLYYVTEMTFIRAF